MIDLVSIRKRKRVLREYAIALFELSYPALFAWWHAVESEQVTMQQLVDRAGIAADQVCAYLSARDRVILGIESATPPILQM